jgi:hypothetical protein
MTKQRWSRAAFTTILCLGGASAACSPRTKPDPRAGTWVMTVSHRPFVILELHQRGAQWTGRLSMPDHWSFSNDGLVYSEVGPGAKSRDITRIISEEGGLHLVFENPKDKTDTDELSATLVDESHMSLVMLDAPIKVTPWRLTRSSAAVTVPNDWNPEQSYVLDLPAGSSSSKMHAMFEADQQARQGGPNADFDAIAPEDAKRRAATRELIASNELHTGRDFREASFIFQHGDRPDDYLLAHACSSRVGQRRYRSALDCGRESRSVSSRDPSASDLRDRIRDEERPHGS